MNSILKSGLLAAAIFTGATGAKAEDTIRFAVTDIQGAEALDLEMGPFKTAFEAASGMKMAFVPVSGRGEACDIMEAGGVDFVLVSPAEYLVFHERLKAEPVVTWNRPDYYSQIVVLDSAPEQTLADLKGKTISFGIVGSTAQHLSPVTLLAEAGLTYRTDYKPVFLKRNAAVEAMIAGEIAAIGLGRSQVGSITKKFDDQKFRVLATGPEVANDVLIAAPSVKPEVVEAVRKVFADHGADLMAAVASVEENDRYRDGSFSVTVTDADFDSTRAMARAVGATDFTAFLKK